MQRGEPNRFDLEFVPPTGGMIDNHLDQWSAVHPEARGDILNWEPQ